MESAPGSFSDANGALNLEKWIIQLCSETPKGITNKDIEDGLPAIDKQQKTSALNRLLSRGQIDLLKQGNLLVYRLKNPDAVKNVKGADTEEKLLYKIIEEAGSKGIWIREIRYKSNLQLQQVNKVLKSLESKKLIKAVKSVAASKKKVYMLYNLQPDRSVTGGSWYSDQDFDSEFVEVLNQQCYMFLQERAANANKDVFNLTIQRNRSCASSQEIWKFICDLKISTVKLSQEDIETILNTLIYDGKIERIVKAGGSQEQNVNTYRAIRPLVQPTGLVRVPCGVCPLINECKEGGVISPSTCQYMKDWLAF